MSAFHTIFLVTLLICYAQCGRKVINPYDKTASVNFLNMEGGGAPRPKPGGVQPVKPPLPVPAPNNPSIQSPSYHKPPQVQNAPGKSPPHSPTIAPTNISNKAVTTSNNNNQRPVVQPTNRSPTSNVPTPGKPVMAGQWQSPHSNSQQSQPTPGPGKVKELINYYDGKGRFDSNSYNKALTGIHAN